MLGDLWSDVGTYLPITVFNSNFSSNKIGNDDSQVGYTVTAHVGCSNSDGYHIVGTPTTLHSSFCAMYALGIHS